MRAKVSLRARFSLRATTGVSLRTRNRTGGGGWCTMSARGLTLVNIQEMLEKIDKKTVEIRIEVLVEVDVVVVVLIDVEKEKLN